MVHVNGIDRLRLRPDAVRIAVSFCQRFDPCAPRAAARRKFYVDARGDYS